MSKLPIKKVVKNNLEFIWKRQYSIPQGLPAVTGLFDFVEQFLGEKITASGEWNNGWLSVYSRQELMADGGRKAADQIERDDKETHYWMSMVYERGKELVSFANNIQSSDNLSLSEIFAIIREYFALFENYIPPLWHSFYAAEAASGAVLNMLRSRNIHNEAEAMSALSKPSEKAHVMKISEYFNQVSNLEERAQYLKENFPWIGSADPLTAPYTYDQLRVYAAAFESGKLVGYSPDKGS